MTCLPLWGPAASAHAAEGVSAQRTLFDHLTTGFELTGQHRDLPCESCHVNAIFKGTPRDCEQCHGVGTSVRASAKPANHILTTNNCYACHTSVAWNPAVNFSHNEVMGSCVSCHYAGSPVGGEGPNHIVTDLDCSVCHSTIGWAGAVFNHNGLTTGCASCHNNVSAKGQPATHIPTVPAGAGSCEGCHTPTNYTTWHDVTGTAAVHATAAGWACQSCHETAQFMGMIPSTGTAAHDSRPSATLDKNHPPTGDCGICHDTTSFSAAASLRPANHIPTSAPCAQCHTTPGQNSSYSVTGTHLGVTECLSCHGPPPAGGWANITIVGTASTNHIPIGNLDCNGSGCHSTSNVNPGGFRLGAASINAPTLNVAGHTTVAGKVPACSTCHETSPYVGMITSTSTVAGDSRPNATLDKSHPASGDCSGCHTTAPTFTTNQSGNAMPANHIPTSAPCAQCHTTAGDNSVYSVTGTHQGVADCLSCHGPPPAGGWANVTIVGTASTNHMPIGNLDCNGSGCHSTAKVTAGGFKIGAASINTPTLNVAGHTTVAAQVGACTNCHETAPYVGMIASTSTVAGDSRPNATLDKNHPTAGDCTGCHTTTPTFASDMTGGSKPANHIPTTAPCAQCHTTANNYALYSVTGTHQGVTDCQSCHGPPPAGGWANVTIVGTASTNHMPIGNLDCNGSGCHSTAKVTAGGFKIGAASISTPTLNVAGHTTVAAQVGACTNCHETAPYVGMIASTSSVAGDSRPNATLDKNHPTAGDCGDCHTQTPTFSSDVSQGAKPANHIPTSAPCAQCHTTAGNFALYSVTGTHQGVTDCLSCHAPAVANTFANIKIVSTGGINHIPIGNLDCNGSGCHSTAKVTAGGFKIGAASISAPTLNVAGHTTVAVQVGACTNCHETAPYVGMIASTASTAGDSRPTAFDKLHPTAGDCTGCHTTTPTFASDMTGGSKPANHIPTTAPCAQCHTTANNYALYSVTGTHQSVSNCLSCHGPPPAGGWANVTIVGTASTNHIPIGNLDCNGSGCHSTTKVTAGGFKLGVANINTPTLSLAGHNTVSGQVGACQTCHQSAPYVGMIASTSTVAGDSRPNATLDKNHPTTGDCGDCHTQTPTFSSDVSQGAKPANHIPTSATCSQCHTTAGNYALYSVTGTHQGVSNCLSCHGPPPSGGWANVTIVGTASTNHMPIGNLDCNGSGCHSTAKVSAGGFRLGAANITVPTLNVAGHSTVAGKVPACTTCHETAPYVGMIASTASTAGDSRPTAFDKLHPTAGDCTGCHTTTPTFASDMTGGSKPANHIPTTAPCAQCHTTANNYALYSVTGTHQSVSNCLSCHGPPPAGGWANVTIVGTASTNHIPIGNLDCNGSGCHSTTKVTAGGFKLGVANINTPTLSLAGHNTVSGQVGACQTCHQSAPYVGMIASTSTVAGDSRPNATLDKNHPTTGDCGDCHTQTPTFSSDVSQGAKPANHIPTSATCSQCHTTAGNYALYSVTGTHQGVSNCLSCHGPPPSGGWANVTIVGTASTNHMPIGNLDCNGSGCHSTAKVSAGGFRLGAANITAPTLNVAGHSTVAGKVPACTTCHETAPYVGMLVSTSSTAGDSRPNATLDRSHPTTGDCSGCHTTTPTFNTDQTGNAKPANHIPTTAPCAQCHTTAGNNAVYSVTGTHQGVSNCLSCHGPPPAGGWANVTIVGTASTNHIPIGNLDCNGSGCHSTTKVTAGGFKLGAASINAPTLNVAGHTTVAGKVPACTTCHETAPYVGMLVSTSSTVGDSRPNATLDKSHPTTGDCSGCHTTTPTFNTDQTGSAKPANHIPTNAPCAQCHTTAGNNAVYSVTGTHQGVTNCLSCHAPAVANTFANITIVSTTGINHIPIGNLDCNGSGCHTTAKLTAGGFKIGAANLNTPTLNVAGHNTVAGQVGACTSCHETAPYVGMIASTSSTAGDSRPNATLDKSHPTTGDCNGCHTNTPTFSSNVSGGSKPANHIPTTAPCAQCHTTAGNYAVYVMGATGHTGITKGCATCHAYGLSFANMAPPTLKQPPSGSTGHIPSNPPNGSKLNVACELCHSPTNFTSFAGTVMRHAYVTTITCMSCHELGMKWKTNTGVRLWVRDSANHHAGQDCGGSGCHNSRDKRAIRPSAAAAGTGGGLTRAGSELGGAAALVPAVGGFNHTRAATTPCVTCHNSAQGAGKPPDHMASSNSCASCHNTHAWLPVVVVDHTQVQGSCASCHNGSVAQGKSRSHIASSNACETCHTTNAWTPARFDHAGVAAHTCRSCHDSVHAMGLPSSHVPTGAQCDSCHGTLAWKPAKVDHTTLTRQCASCHNNAVALGVPATHMNSKLDCATCHSYPDWTLTHFMHTGGAYPGDHKAALACTACHTSNSDLIPWPAPANAGSCAGCHTKDFKPAAHPKTSGGILYTSSELRDCAGACHVYSDASAKTIVKSQPGPYHRPSNVAFKH